MMKYIYTFILILMGYSCETSSNKPEDTKNEAVKIEASPVEVLNEASTVHPKDGFNAQEFCACVDSIGINDCMYEYDRVRGISIDTFIVETPCYQELRSILEATDLPKVMVFGVRDRKGRIHYIPLEGILSCMDELKPKWQMCIVRRCKSLAKSPTELHKFLTQLAQRVASRRL